MGVTAPPIVLTFLVKPATVVTVDATVGTSHRHDDIASRLEQLLHLPLGTNRLAQVAIGREDGRKRAAEGSRHRRHGTTQDQCYARADGNGLE